MIGKTNIGSGSSLSFKGALICITAPTGSTITLIKNNLIIKTLYPKDQHVLFNDNTRANWYYSISPSNYGDWTITTTFETNIDSRVVSINDNKKYHVKPFWLELFVGGIGPKVNFILRSSSGGQLPTVTQNQIELVGNDSWGGRGIFTEDQIDLTPYKTIIVDGHAAIRMGSTNEFVAISLTRPSVTKIDGGDDDNMWKSKRVTYQELPTTRGLTELDISSYTGLYYVYIGGTNLAYAYNWYLSVI